jgi:uncharacterized protein YyaL (SSP411 family)
MSYDNSELLKNYLHGFQVLGRQNFRLVAEGIIGWVGEVLSDPDRGGFYASQDADQTLDDDGDYFTWTQAELRAALTPDEARVAELYYDVGPRGEMHHDAERNVLWIAETIEGLCQQLKMSEDQAVLVLARAKAKLLEVRRRRRPTPAVDTTLYVAWNAMFVSAYLEAATVLDRADCRAFALKTLARILQEAWEESQGFLHRVGGPRLEGSLDDQVFAAAALVDAYEATFDRRYLDTAERAMRRAMDRFGDPDGGGFFDRPNDAQPMGGIDVRRKPLQDSPTPGANSVAAMVLDRLYALTGEASYRVWAERTLEAFIGPIPQYGLFASTYALAALLHARHPLEVIVTGATGDGAAEALEKAARSVYRLGKTVLRVTPERLANSPLPAALEQTLPHLDREEARAFVCIDRTCYPPVSEPEKLRLLLRETATGVPSAS